MRAKIMDPRNKEIYRKRSGQTRKHIITLRLDDEEYALIESVNAKNLSNFIITAAINKAKRRLQPSMQK